jgi:hypothetical protein
VPCTGAALRRPSAWLVLPHGEGCFSPAGGWYTIAIGAAWNDPANRGPAPGTRGNYPAGPRALRVPGRVVDAPRDIGLPGMIPGSPFSFPRGDLPAGAGGW